MKGKLRMITAMLIFGSIGIFVKNINLSSLEIAFLRALMGSLFLIGTGFILRQEVSSKFIRKNLLLLILSGGAIGLNWLCLFEAYKYTTVSIATFSYYFVSIFVLILSPIILKEKLTTTKVVCILGAMLGLFLILNGNGSTTTGYDNHVKGIIYGLFGAALYAGVILMNKFLKDLSGYETTLIQLIVAALVLLPRILYQGSLKLTNIDMRSWIFILILGLVHTGFAYLLYFSAIKELKGQSIAILSYIDPIFAVVFSTLFLGETMTFTQAIGGILILGSTFLSERGQDSKEDLVQGEI